MKIKYTFTVLVLAMLAVFLCIKDSTSPSLPAVKAAETDRPTRQGAWLNSMVFSEQGDPNAAVAQLQANELDVYAYTVSDSTLYQAVLEDNTLSRDESYQNYFELTFNPSGPTFIDGRLNPFSNAKIREAMNWLVDRNKIAQEIDGGIAVPKYLPLVSIDADYARFQSSIEALEAQYAYNFILAQTTIATEMEAMGANLVNGTWYYNGEPVTIIFIIRVEDKRLNIGDYVSDQLEAIGFTVDRQYKTRSEASPIWNLSDPAEGQWHIYTGGWISTSVNRDIATNFGYFYTPLGSASPLWQAYNPTPEFQEICYKLWVDDFSTLEERSILFEQALALAMNDSGAGSVGSGSLHVWLVDQITFAPKHSAVVVASDQVGSITGAAMFPYVARFYEVEGGELRIAQPGLLIEPWNPIAGSNWIYDTFPIRATADRGILSDPNTGLYWPLRIESADVVVKTGLAITKTLDWVTLTTTDTIEVPGNAWVDWDAANQEFITAGEKYTYTLTANSKVSVHYPADMFNTVTWHDGSPISLGDFVMNMIMKFDPAKPDSPIYDESQVPSLDAFLSHFKGLMIESTNPLVITTYDDVFYLDAELMVQTWYPSGGYYSSGNSPWHSLTPAIRAEEVGELAFSAEKANQLGVEWTNFIGGPSLAILESWMNQSASEHYIPYLPTMGNYVTQGEADARWAALQAWYTAHHHFWLGTGPFYVQQISYDPKSLTLARFDAYPDAAGRWDAFAAPAQPELLINHTSGAPGSYFNVTGTGFPPNGQATIVVNNHILDQLQVDSSGGISFTLSSERSAPGQYHLRVSVNPSAGVQFTLDLEQPVQPREGELPIIPLPQAFYIHIPVVNRN